MFVKTPLPQARERLATVPDGAPLIQAAKLLGVGTDIVVVCNAAGSLAGVITKSDVVNQISRCEGASCRTPASLVMAKSVVTCNPRDFLRDLWAIMKERRLKNIPIVDSDKRPIGILNARDVLDALLGEVENEEALLRDFVMCAGYR